MARYSTSVRSDTTKVNVEQKNFTVDVNNTEYKVSLSRSGSQGAKGNSVTNAYLQDGNLYIEISDSTGNLVETVNAGLLDGNLSLSIDNFADFDITGIQDGQGLIYNGNQQALVPHSFTTSSLGDVDNTNRSDGSVLVYNGTASKYEATNTLNNANTTITGGNF